MRTPRYLLPIALLALLATQAQDPLFEDPFADLAQWGSPPGWTVSEGALTVAGGDIRVCRTGAEWGNVAIEFEVAVRSLLAQWVIRARGPEDCCFIQLTSSACPYAPNSLRYHRWQAGKLLDIKEDALPIEIELGKAYRVRCEVVGSTVQTLIDGKVRGQWDLGTGYERGTIGFRASERETASYRGLRVLRCETLTPLGRPRKAPLARAVQHDTFLMPPFRAEWVWGPGDSLDQAFRWSFDAGAAVLEARLWITCDNAFKLYANGTLVGQGSDWYSPQLLELTPHLRVGRNVLVFETPNDRERYTLVRVQPPWRNLGCGPYTGRDMACDGRPYQAGFVFYPEAEGVRLTISRLPCELTIGPESGGAVSRLWLFEMVDDLGSRPAEIVPPPGPQREIGIAQTHPGYLYELYGRRGDTLVGRLASLKAFADYATFVGLNRLEYNAVNGADTSETAYYPSAIWNRYRGDVDLFAEFLPLAEARGLSVVPCLTSLALDIDRFASAPWISPLTFQIDRDGFSRRDFFANRGNDNTLPDPLRPEVQKVFLDTLREFGERCQGSSAVKGLAFRLNGKIGTCYVGYDEKATAATCGFSPWDLAEFQKDTGVRLPEWDDGLLERWLAAIQAKRHDDAAVRFIPAAYEWLRANHWQEWTDWRCRRFAQLILAARDLVRSFRPDWVLLVKCDMPSETPDRNLLWPAGTAPLELLRDHGFDPRRFANEPGIVLQQGYFIGGGEYFHHAGGGSYYQNPEAWAAFDYQPGLAELYRAPAGTSVEFYHNYWEEFGVARMGEFATDFWGAGTMFPAGRHFFRPLLHALRTNNVHSMALFSWERGSSGHEGELRRFCRAFRALPAVAPEAFEGTVAVTAGPAADEGLWLRRFGPRLALVNECPQPRTVRIELVRVDSAEALYEYASQRQLVAPGPAGKLTATIELDGFDLRVLGCEKP